MHAGEENAVRVLVCGGRHWGDAQTIKDRLAQLPERSTVIHGAAAGADYLGCAAAMQLSFNVESYPADWDRYGRSAGPIRNEQMLKAKPDLVLAFHADLEHSRGTKHMVTIARKAGVPVEVITGEEKK
jgi:hypothetical protein